MTKPDRIDNFLAMQSTRTDSWRSVHTAAKDWAAGTGSKAKTEAALAEIAVIEEFHAFPGVRLMNRLRDKLAAGEAAVVADLVRQYADAILTGRYTQMSEADGSAEGGDALPEVLAIGYRRARHAQAVFRGLMGKPATPSTVARDLRGTSPASPRRRCLHL